MKITRWYKIAVLTVAWTCGSVAQEDMVEGARELGGEVQRSAGFEEDALFQESRGRQRDPFSLNSQREDPTRFQTEMGETTLTEEELPVSKGGDIFDEVLVGTSGELASGVPEDSAEEIPWHQRMPIWGKAIVALGILGVFFLLWKLASAKPDDEPAVRTRKKSRDHF